MRSGLLPLPSGPAHCNSQGGAAALEPAPTLLGKQGSGSSPHPPPTGGLGWPLCAHLAPTCLTLSCHCWLARAGEGRQVRMGNSRHFGQARASLS